jgi:hypothetical protein
MKMRYVKSVFCLVALLLLFGADAQMQSQNTMLNGWRSHSVGNAHENTVGQAVVRPISADDFNHWYEWLWMFDMSKYFRYTYDEFVCVNFSVNSLKSCADEGFTNIYACQIQNFENKGGHFVVAANVGPGLIYWNPTGLSWYPEGQKTFWTGGWIIVDPQDDKVLNDDLRSFARKGVQQNITIFEPGGFNSKFWASGKRGLACIIGPEYVVADFTINKQEIAVPLNRYPLLNNITTLTLVPVRTA